MAPSSDDSDDDNFVVLGTAVPELVEGEPQKKPTTVQDLTARDKQGRRRFHGAFTGGFSAGYFNTVGSQEGFTPSTFVSSRSRRDGRSESRPEDFMDEEDFDEHGIAPRKFATVASYTSEERKRKRHDDTQHLAATASVNLTPVLTDFVIAEQLPIGIKLLQKMGWREGQGLGPRVRRKKKKKKKTEKKSTIKPDSTFKVYGCAGPPSDPEESDSDSFIPENMSDITFAPRDVCPISLEVKDNVHGLGYRGLDPSLALPGSHVSLFQTKPGRSRQGHKGIQGQAFGVGAFEDEDEDIFAADNMSNYDTTMRLDDDDEGDGNFGWTAPRKHGKQSVPVSYVGKLLEGFTLSSQTLKPKQKFPPPVLPAGFKPQHWFRKRREVSHLPADVVGGNSEPHQKGNLTAFQRGLILGEIPVMQSVFDLMPTQDKGRLEASMQAVAMSQSLTRTAEQQATTRDQAETNTKAPAVSTTGQSDSAGTATFLAKFKPAEVTPVEPNVAGGQRSKVAAAANSTPLFPGSLSFQPFRKDAGKQARYDIYLTALKQGITEAYSAVGSSHLTEWEKARERDEFSKAAKIFRPMSAMMSSRFVRGAMIDEDRAEVSLNTEEEKSDKAKAAEMNMFGKLTREEFEWHPDKLLCRRFNVPNPYPGSDLVGLPVVKRDKYSVFNFLNFADYRSGDFQEPLAAKPELSAPEPVHKAQPVQAKKAAMTSIFRVLDDPDFHQAIATTTVDSRKKDDPGNDENQQKNKGQEPGENETQVDMDLFRAIFKNSDSESSSNDSDDDNVDDNKDKAVHEGEENEMSGTNSSSQAQDSLPHPGGTYSLNQAQTSPPVTSTSAVLDSEVRSRSWFKRGEKSIFSVLDDDDEHQQLSGKHPQIAADISNMETTHLLSRLSPPPAAAVPEEHESGEEEYGPRLPPSSSSTTDPSFNNQTPEPKKIYTTAESRDRHHHHPRKEKKKKSKHKKDKKHKKHKKSKKTSRSRGEQSWSGSEADTEDSDVSDSELLHRLKELSGSSRKHQLLKHI